MFVIEILFPDNSWKICFNKKTDKKLIFKVLTHAVDAATEWLLNSVYDPRNTLRIRDTETNETLYQLWRSRQKVIINDCYSLFVETDEQVCKLNETGSL